MLCPHCKQDIPAKIETIIKELVFQEVHRHEVNTSRSVHPAELQGLRELLKKNGKLVME